MVGHGVLADEQAQTDLAIGQAFSDTSQHLGLARGQSGWQQRAVGAADGSAGRGPPTVPDSCCQLVGSRDRARRRAGRSPGSVIVAAQSNRTSTVQSGDPLRSASWRAARSGDPRTSCWPHSSVSPASSRSAGPKRIVNAAIRLRPLNGRSSVSESAGAVRVTEREAGLGEERQAGRPHRIAGNRGEGVWCQGGELRARLVEHSQLGVQRGETRSPHRRWVVGCGKRSEHRGDFVEPALERVGWRTSARRRCRRWPGSRRPRRGSSRARRAPRQRPGRRRRWRGSSPGGSPSTGTARSDPWRSPCGTDRGRATRRRGRRGRSGRGTGWRCRRRCPRGLRCAAPSASSSRAASRMRVGSSADVMTACRPTSSASASPICRAWATATSMTAFATSGDPRWRALVRATRAGAPAAVSCRRRPGRPPGCSSSTAGPPGRPGEVRRQLEQQGRLGGDVGSAGPDRQRERLPAALAARRVQAHPQPPWRDRRAPRRARQVRRARGRARRRGARPPRRTPPSGRPGQRPAGRSTRPCRPTRWARRRRSAGPARRAPAGGRQRVTASMASATARWARRRARGDTVASTVSRTRACSNSVHQRRRADGREQARRRPARRADASSSVGGTSRAVASTSEVDPLAGDRSDLDHPSRAAGDSLARRAATTSRTLSGTIVVAPRRR